ncbi:integrase arm-type DNA-binding domain-containing protein [Mesorhizobium sp. AR10]|nr:integrase arm-type DNA-binding domain-containing protein [Mesorhizobium sp. AR10]
MGKKVGNVARTLQKLTDVKVKSDKLKPGRHSDGGGLYLNVSPTSTKSWLFMWTPAGGRRREMGLGAYPAVTLAKARGKAAECRVTIEEGRDPIAERAKEEEPDFGDCADKFLASMEGSWRNEKHRAQWKMTLLEYCKPMRPKKVSLVGTDDVLEVLTPIWSEKPETASRLRGRIERVLDFAKTKGWRSGENPALWRGHLKNVLPARKKLSRGHHPAMPYPEVPSFVARLRIAEAIAARALEFLILTTARSGEVYGAKWPELDFDAGVWTVPAKRMKAGKEHRVPLSKRALEVVKSLYETKISDYVFPGQGKDKPLSTSAMDMLLGRMKVDEFTVHGFRSSFRDWAGDKTNFPREVAEAALAHEIGSAVERAYRRADAIEKRRKLMQAWADYLAAKKVGNVVNLDEARKA